MSDVRMRPIKETITLDALAVRTGSGEFDAAAAGKASVKAKVAGHVLGEKIRVGTYKPKSTFKKTRGYRSRLSQLTIESITLKADKESKGGA